MFLWVIKIPVSKTRFSGLIKDRELKQFYKQICCWILVPCLQLQPVIKEAHLFPVRR